MVTASVGLRQGFWAQGPGSGSVALTLRVIKEHRPREDIVMSICRILTIPSLICLRSTSDEFISNIIRVPQSGFRVAVLQAESVQVASQSPLRVLHRQAYPGNIQVQHGGAIRDLPTMSRGSSQFQDHFYPTSTHWPSVVCIHFKDNWGAENQFCNDHVCLWHSSVMDITCSTPSRTANWYCPLLYYKGNLCFWMDQPAHLQ